ncbi:MAG: tetratricopeptide repeat protein [Spirochaetota bacterium]
MKLIKILLIIIILGIINKMYAAEMILPEKDKFLKAYYTQADNLGWDVELKGKITLIGAKYKNESGIVDKIKDKTNASVRLYNNIGIGTGDELYVIDSNNLIISKITVDSVFDTKTFGYLLLGYGNFRLANPGDRVVQRIDAVHSRKAYVYNGKADYHQNTGQTGQAISFYKKSLEVDKNNPEAHLSLGYLYLKDDMLEYAYNEFNEILKQKRRLYDNEDKFLLYKGLAETRFKQVYYTKIGNELRSKYINDGIEFSKKALQIYPDSKDVNYYLGVFYYKNSQPSDALAKEQFVKVIELDQENVEAYLALAELYDKHNNKPKAVFYAEQALKLDPVNDRVKFILKRLR